jgi:hypothetical protein
MNYSKTENGFAGFVAGTPDAEVEVEETVEEMKGK